MKLTATQRRLQVLWAENPSSRTAHRLKELRRLVWRDLLCAARRTRASRAREAGR
jgi:hypothetical protein